jgi:hypothetical protein
MFDFPRDLPFHKDHAVDPDCRPRLVVAMRSLLGRAFEAASPLTDREIIERLARLEEGQNALR